MTETSALFNSLIEEFQRIHMSLINMESDKTCIKISQLVSMFVICPVLLLVTEV